MISPPPDVPPPEAPPPPPALPPAQPESPPAVAGPLLRRLTGHRGAIRAVAVTADGTRAVSGSDDTTLKVWDLEHGKELVTLSGHPMPVRAVALTPDGKYAVSGSEDATLKVWDLERGQEGVTLSGHSGSVLSLALTPDGKRAISGSMDGTMKVWNIEYGQEIRTLTHGRGVSAVAVTPDGQRAVSGTCGGTVTLWDLESGKELAVLAGALTHVGSLATVIRERRDTPWAGFQAWEPRSAEGITILASGSGLLRVTPGGRYVVDVTDDLRVRDMEFDRVHVTDVGHIGTIRALAITPDGRLAITGADDETLMVWALDRVRLSLEDEPDLDEALLDELAAMGFPHLGGKPNARVRGMAVRRLKSLFQAESGMLSETAGVERSAPDPRAVDASWREILEANLESAEVRSLGFPFSYNIGDPPVTMAQTVMPRVPDTLIGASQPRGPTTVSPSERSAREPIRIGASAPRWVRPGQEFTARLAAYSRTLLLQVKKTLHQPGAKRHMNLAETSWPSGAKIRVALTGTHLLVEQAIQEFVWQDEIRAVDFDVRVREDIEEDTGTRLRFDVFVVDVPGCEAVPVARVRLTLEIRCKRYWLGRLRPHRVQFAARPAFHTAFASYHAADRANVLTRLDAIQQLTGMKFFHECLSVQPSGEREPFVQREIVARDLFLLFWSRRAAESREVEWEWRTALARKGLEAMQAQRLEPEPLLPPELEPLDRTVDGQNLAALGTALAARVLPRKSTILFLAADPLAGERRALDREAREIEAKIQATPYRDALALITCWAVRPDDLLQAFSQHRPAVVHFAGQGTGELGIALHDDAGGTRLVTAAALQWLFTTLRDDIRLVVFNACYSHEQALAVAEVIDCVVGMSDRIGDDAARAFAASFYRALGFGRSVRNAFDQGLAAIALAGLEAEHVPRLLTHAGVDADHVYIVAAPGTTAREPVETGVRAER